MTPKEKATELVMKFTIIEYQYKNISKRKMAKGCAKETVNEILSALIYPPKGHRQTVQSITLEYWNEVLTEIDNL